MITLNQLLTWGRQIISHPKLREGHVFRPRFYPRALRLQKSERRKLLGLPRSAQGKAPLSQSERRRLRQRTGGR